MLKLNVEKIYLNDRNTYTLSVYNFVENSLTCSNVENRNLIQEISLMYEEYNPASVFSLYKLLDSIKDAYVTKVDYLTFIRLKLKERFQESVSFYEEFQEVLLDLDFVDITEKLQDDSNFVTLAAMSNGLPIIFSEEETPDKVRNKITTTNLFSETVEEPKKQTIYEYIKTQPNIVFESGTNWHDIYKLTKEQCDKAESLMTSRYSVDKMEGDRGRHLVHALRNTGTLDYANMGRVEKTYWLNYLRDTPADRLFVTEKDIEEVRAGLATVPDDREDIITYNIHFHV